MERVRALTLSLLAVAMAMVMAMAVAVAVAVAMAESSNHSPLGGMVWSTAKEEKYLLEQEQPNQPSNADLDGGFSSLEGMLQWAIGHSDPSKLKQNAQDVQRLSLTELKHRQLELKELMEKLKMPSDARLMQIALDDLKNSSLSLEDRHRALEELLVLVEPIDNANDLCKLGGIGTIIGQLNHQDPDIRKTSAWVLGKASQNNPFVQKQVLELGALVMLMKMVKSNSAEEATKALYAISALIRNNLAGQELFYAEAGDTMIQDILSNTNIDIRLRRKAVFLIGDLAECQLENTQKADMPFFNRPVLLKAIVDLIASTDLDLQEKALVAIKNLLQLETTEALLIKDFCGLDVALERMKEQLKELMLDEDHRDYIADVEGLRKEVELIFYKKLRKGIKVSLSEQDFGTSATNAKFLMEE